MNKQQIINEAIGAGVLSNENIYAFDFAGNYRVAEVKEGEVVFEHIANRSLLHWII